MELGDKIKEIRKSKRMKQSDLADKAQISRVAVGNYERNERRPSADILKRIADALEVQPNVLLGYSLEEQVTKELQGIRYLEALGFIVTNQVVKWHWENEDDPESKVQYPDEIEVILSKGGHTVTLAKSEYDELHERAAEFIEGYFSKKVLEHGGK